MAGEFPIVEAFGFRWDASTPEAKAAARKRWCPFAESKCEKFRQYGFGYCSVRYSAADDQRTERTYAVCDHRLDGAPLAHVTRDHFGKSPCRLVPEIVLTNPRTSFDYVAFDPSNINNIIAIETQAIDIRGGGVGPAWKAWMDGSPDKWRAYFTAEAKKKGRKDNVAYGVNMANIYKRLGLQVAVKGGYLKEIKIPFYVLMQHRPFEYLHRRIKFVPTTGNDAWDISFVTFDYTGATKPDGSLEFAHVQTIRTTVASYLAAMSSDRQMSSSVRDDFLERVKRKAGLL